MHTLAYRLFFLLFHLLLVGRTQHRKQAEKEVAFARFHFIAYVDAHDASHAL